MTTLTLILLSVALIFPPSLAQPGRTTPNELKVLESIHFNDSTKTNLMWVEYRKIGVWDWENGNWLFNMTTRMYCWFNVQHCDVPGPNFIMYPGILAKLQLINLLQGFGPNYEQSPPPYIAGRTFLKKQDVTNMHTHGLHVSPAVDDIVDVHIPPACGPGYNRSQGCYINGVDTPASHIYSYLLPSYHYPGSHWYHSHNHGSVTTQVSGGLYGGIAVKPSLTYKEPFNSFWYIMNFVYLVPAANCNCATFHGCKYRTDQWSSAPLCSNTLPANVIDTGRAGFGLPSQCYLWCQYTPAERNASGLTFDATLGSGKTSAQFFLVNGDYKPKKTLTAGGWQRFRMVNTNSVYILFHINATRTDCAIWYIAQDGIFFRDSATDKQKFRDFFSLPYNRVIVLPVGGRTDIAMRCRYPGRKYSVWALTKKSPLLTSQQQAVIKNIEAQTTDCDGQGSVVPLPPTDIEMGTITVTGTTNAFAPGDAELQGLSPPYSETIYLKDTLKSSTFTTHTTTPIGGRVGPTRVETAVNTFNLILPHKPNPITGFNNVSFNASEALLEFQTGPNIVHEWTVFMRFHPFHHHTWPYQVQVEYPSFGINDGNREYNGWWVQKGEWRDVVGVFGSLVMRVNYVANGSTAFQFYTGKLVTHCHYVLHEDRGMMAWYQMTLANVDAPVYPYSLSIAYNTSLTCGSAIKTGVTIINMTTLKTYVGMNHSRLSDTCFGLSLFGQSRESVKTFHFTMAVLEGTGMNNAQNCTNTGIGYRVQWYSVSVDNNPRWEVIPVHVSPPYKQATLGTGGSMNCKRTFFINHGRTFEWKIDCLIMLMPAAPIFQTYDSVLGTLSSLTTAFTSTTMQSTSVVRPVVWIYGEGIMNPAFGDKVPNLDPPSPPAPQEYYQFAGVNAQGCNITLCDGLCRGVTTTCTFSYFALIGIQHTNIAHRTFQLATVQPNATTGNTTTTATPTGLGLSGQVIADAHKQIDDMLKNNSDVGIVSMVFSILAFLVICVFVVCAFMNQASIFGFKNESDIAASVELGNTSK